MLMKRRALVGRFLYQDESGLFFQKEFGVTSIPSFSLIFLLLKDNIELHNTMYSLLVLLRQSNVLL